MPLITPIDARLLSDYPQIYNLAIIRATTTNAGDSIKITSADGSALSSANVGRVRVNGTTAGYMSTFTVTADVTILLTGAHWGIGTTGDITGALLRVLAINDNGTLRWGVALQGGRETVTTTDTNATPTSVTTPEGVLCNTAVGSATNRTLEVGYFRADFDDTGGAAEDLWAVQTGIDDCVTGQSADGQWQPWNPTFGGFSVNPTVSIAQWTQVKSIVTFQFKRNANGTSNATTFTLTLPIKAKQTIQTTFGGGVDNGATLATDVVCETTAGSTTLNLYTTAGAAAWTAANAKGAFGMASYQIN